MTNIVFLPVRKREKEQPPPPLPNLTARVKEVLALFR